MKKYIVYGEPGIPASKVALLYGVDLKECILVNPYEIKNTLGLDKSKYIELYPDTTDKYDLKETVIKELRKTNRMLVFNTKTKEIEIKDFYESLFKGIYIKNAFPKDLSVLKDGEFKSAEEIIKELSENIEKILGEEWSD